MPNESGTWFMRGLDRNDPTRIKTIKEAADYINKVGFLPLFANSIPGFSLEEHTAADFWWSGDPDRDPWEWREIITRSGEIAYGKFFEKKAGFISREWFPFFANFRRDGYDFDALWDDEKASRRQKKIMDLFLEENAEAEIYSNELKERAGFGKGGEKGFEDVLAKLQMQTYLLPMDFLQRKNKNGKPYGWPIAVYTTPEHIFGKEFVISAYSEPATESGNRIMTHLSGLYPDASAAKLSTILGTRAGTTKH